MNWPSPSDDTYTLIGRRVWSAVRETLDALMWLAITLGILLLIAFLMGGWTRGY